MRVCGCAYRLCVRFVRKRAGGRAGGGANAASHELMTEVTGRVAAPVTQRQAASGADASAWAANLAFASSIFRP